MINSYITIVINIIMNSWIIMGKSTNKLKVKKL